MGSPHRKEEEREGWRGKERAAQVEETAGAKAQGGASDSPWAWGDTGR